MLMLTNFGDYARYFLVVQVIRSLFFVRVAANHGQPLVLIPHLRVTI